MAVKIPFVGKKKEKKTYLSVLGNFRTAVEDMAGIIVREKAEKKELIEEKEILNLQIDCKTAEIADCEVAMDNMCSMFPNLMKNSSVVRTVDVSEEESDGILR